MLSCNTEHTLLCLKMTAGAVCAAWGFCCVAAAAVLSPLTRAAGSQHTKSTYHKVCSASCTACCTMLAGIVLVSWRDNSITDQSVTVGRRIWLLQQMCYDAWQPRQLLLEFATVCTMLCGAIAAADNHVQHSCCGATEWPK